MFKTLAALSVLFLSTSLLAAKPGGGGSSSCGLKRCYITGNAADVVKPTTPGFLLVGGGTDQDAAMQWMIAKSGGGDFVVIRASGTEAYNPYIFGLGTVDSVETMIIDSRTVAANPYVVDRLRKAEAIFIAGGAQNDYINYWKGTPVETEINAAITRGVPVGGTSAGLAVMGQFIYSSLGKSSASVDVLADPYHRDVTLARDFIIIPQLAGLITDSHFVSRDRMGRLLGFMARLVQDGWTSEIKAIGIDEMTALAVEADGSSSLFGPGAVYFLERAGMPEVCRVKTPLTYRKVSVHKIQGAETFNISSWSGSAGQAYELSVEAGAVSSTSGNIY